MASLRRGLVNTVKKAAAKVGTRGVQAAAKAGTRGARALVETTAAAVKTVDKLQAKLGRRSHASAPFTQKPLVAERKPGPAAQPRRVTPPRTPEAQPVELREAGRKAMPAAAPKRSKPAKPAGPQAKVKRGQKHRHTGR
jgi:hypothetical protein